MPDKPTILIAEDDPVLREVYTKKFTMSGYSIITAENGKEALDALQSNTPDILILDLNMPVMDGFTVLEQFPPNTRKFPVIILSNFADEKNKQRGKELGADDYFVKSDMTIRKLLQMVQTLLKAKRYWKQ